MSIVRDHLDLALDEAERELYRAARECTDAMRSFPGVNDQEIEARSELLAAARGFVAAEDAVVRYASKRERKPT